MGDVVGRVREHGLRDAVPSQVVPVLAERARDLLETLAIPVASVVGVGVAAPGPLDLERGSIVGAPTMVSWQGFPLRAAIEDALGLPTVLDNDATCAGVGEFWGGGTAESAAHCTVYMGAGIGAGIVIGGSVYRGASSNTGEIGQLRARSSATERATIEDVAAPRAVAAAARVAIAAGRPTSIELRARGIRSPISRLSPLRRPEEISSASNWCSARRNSWPTRFSPSPTSSTSTRSPSRVHRSPSRGRCIC